MAILMRLPWETVAHGLAEVGKALMIAALFLLGTGLGPAEIRRAGVRPLFCAVTLWALVGAATLAATLSGLIRPPEQRGQASPFDIHAISGRLSSWSEERGLPNMPLLRN